MQLSKRDRMALTVGGSCLVLFLFLQLFFFPLLKSRDKLERGIATRQNGIVMMQDLAERFAQMKVQNSELASQLDKRAKDFSLFSFLEKNANAAGVKESIEYMKPSDASGDEEIKQTLVEMKLKAIGLTQLVNFLQHIESPENLVGIKRIAIQENTREKGALDVTLQVVSVDAIQEAE
jgi:general secretion pathway protein M